MSSTQKQLFVKKVINMYKKNDLLKKLKNDNLNFTIYDHQALFSVKDSREKRGSIKGSHTKNLFLKNKKQDFFLFSCNEKTQIDLKRLSKILLLGNISFAKEDHLYKYLGVEPGSVTPFGLLNDIENKVKFFLDSSLFDEIIVNFHPLINTSTIGINIHSFVKFLNSNKKDVNIFDFNNYTLIC